MAKFEYKGDGTVEIAGLGTLSPGDVIAVPDSFDLKSRADFKGGSGEVVRTVEEPVAQPDQEPVDAPAPTPSDSTPSTTSSPSTSSSTTTSSSDSTSTPTTTSTGA